MHCKRVTTDPSVVFHFASTTTRLHMNGLCADPPYLMTKSMSPTISFCLPATIVLIFFSTFTVSFANDLFWICNRRSNNKRSIMHRASA